MNRGRSQRTFIGAATAGTFLATAGVAGAWAVTSGQKAITNTQLTADYVAPLSPLNTNVTGTFLCAQAAFRAMAAQQPRGGRIINNGSISAYTPRPFAIAYNATKHAVSGITKSLSLEGRAFDIACGQIDIGNAATEMTERMSGGVPQADGSLKPEPTMDVAHVARAIVYMASLPLDANVQTMTVMATTMPFVGRG